MDKVIFGSNVKVDDSSSVNNTVLGDNVKIAKRCSVFGSQENELHVGENSYIGMNSILNGFNAKLSIGSNVSIAPNVHIMTDSGPNASKALQEYYPIIKGNIQVGNDSWIGSNSIIMPGVHLGVMCVVAANSFVDESFGDYSVIGGTPARLIKKLPCSK